MLLPTDGGEEGLKWISARPLQFENADALIWVISDGIVMLLNPLQLLKKLLLIFDMPLGIEIFFKE